MAKRLFGTDGIRGRAGAYPLDPATVYAVGLALSKTPAVSRGGEVALGMDTRESGLAIAETLAGGLEAGGLRARFAGVLPTAGVSFAASEPNFAAGVMISASHNPFDDNGVKVFGPEGYKLPDEIEAAIEDEIFRLLEAGVAPARRSLTRDPEIEERYVRHLVDAGPPISGPRPLRLVVDCANGAASTVARAFFNALGVETPRVLSDRPDGRNINVDCGSLHLDNLRRAVLESGADLGVAFDGDADRALFVADDGEIVDGDVVLLLGALHLKAAGRLPSDRVATTVMANLGLETALREAGIGLTRTRVGDKYVLEAMLAGGAGFGGEQSGHVILLEFARTGDGLLTARLMLETLAASGERLSRLRRAFRPFPQKLVNIRVKSKPDIAEVPALSEAVALAEAELGERGRVVVRYSGTEPVARVMVEAADFEDVDLWCARLEAVFTRELAP